MQTIRTQYVILALVCRIYLFSYLIMYALTLFHLFFQAKFQRPKVVQLCLQSSHLWENIHEWRKIWKDEQCEIWFHKTGRLTKLLLEVTKFDKSNVSHDVESKINFKFLKKSSKTYLYSRCGSEASFTSN